SLAAIFDLEGPILRAMDDQQRLAAQAIWINRLGEQLRRQPPPHADGPGDLFGRGQNGGNRQDPALAETGDEHASRVAPESGDRLLHERARSFPAGTRVVSVDLRAVRRKVHVIPPETERPDL